MERESLERRIARLEWLVLVLFAIIIGVGIGKAMHVVGLWQGWW